VASSRVRGVFKLKVRPTITTKDQIGHAAKTEPAARANPTGNTAPAADGRISLLAAVDFKWLMTGHGWWVDSARFHADPSYAATLLGLAMESPSAALRECAARLLAQMGGAAASNLLPGNGFAASGPGSL
jgi:hypothetical protein